MYEENKSIVREFFEKVVNAGNLDHADDLVSPGYVEHQELPGGEDRQGIEVAKGFLSLMRGAFPDFRFEIEDLIAEGDKVAARVSVSGTPRRNDGACPHRQAREHFGHLGVPLRGRQDGRALGGV